MAAWIVQSSFVAMAILAAVHVLRVRSADLREALLLVALAKFAVPPSLLPFGSLFDVLAPLSAPAASAGVAFVAAASAPAPAARPLLWLAAVYFAGAIAVLACAIGGHRRLLRSLRTATYADAALQARLVELAASIGCRGLITLQCSDRIAAPIAVGVFRRRIIVPARLLASLSPPEIDAVLLHEMGHHRRGHIAGGWARAAVCAAWWWNPLAWMVARALRHTQEEVCDDLAIERAGMPADRYCDVLVHAASIAATPAGAAAFAQQLHPLGRRVKRLLDGAPTRAAAWKAWVTAIVAACAVLPGAAARQAPAQPPSSSVDRQGGVSADPVQVGASDAAAVAASVPRPRRAAALAVEAAGATAIADASVPSFETPPGAPSDPAPSAPVPPAPSPFPIADLLSLAGLPEVLVEVPTTVAEVRRDWADNMRDILYRDLRRAGAPEVVAAGVSANVGGRIARREAVRHAQRSMVRALNPLNWFRSGSSSPSPSPSRSPSPSPSPSPSKNRQ